MVIIEQDACYVENPKPSRAVRFDYMTFHGMSYLTAQNEWTGADSECKSDQMCPDKNETSRTTNCISCSHKIVEGSRFSQDKFRWTNLCISLLNQISASESAPALETLKSSVEEAGYEFCFPLPLIYGLISRLSVENGKLVPLQGGWTDCRQLRYR